MAYDKPTTITSWSYSRFGTYKSCPFKAKLTILEKLQEPKNIYMERGSAIHELSEKYIKGELRALPKELKAFDVELKRLRAKRAKFPGLVAVEEMWVFRRDWTETVWNDWSGAWARVKLDVAEVTEASDVIVVMITDIKTGKFSSYNLADYVEQLELYGLAALLKYKDRGKALEVRARLLYVDSGTTYPTAGSTDDRVFTLADLPRLKKSWEAKVKPMLNDKTFAPKPNQWCGNCHFRANNTAPDAKLTGGGRCKY